ncbi:MAG: hypothetical protein PHV34_08995 [Verrucomicrobiae bacterium]|nr:hypothetical protein [Verrucomicrobiae bacterium]
MNQPHQHPTLTVLAIIYAAAVALGIAFARYRAQRAIIPQTSTPQGEL